MDQKELINTIANLSGMPKPDIWDVLLIAGDVIAETMSTGECVSVPGFGKFKPVRSKDYREFLMDGSEQFFRVRRRIKFRPIKLFRDRFEGSI